MIIKKKEKECIAIASRFLLEERIIIIPTDTVYGFSGIMESKTEQELYKIKKRSTDKKLIYLVANPNDILKYIDVTFYENEEIEHLTSFWPAPLTVIFKARSTDKNQYATIAFRCPDDVWLRSLISTVGHPIFSTSANISGNDTITNSHELNAIFGNEVSLIVDGGKLEGISSTVLDASKRPFTVVRSGSFQLDM